MRYLFLLFVVLISVNYRAQDTLTNKIHVSEIWLVGGFTRSFAVEGDLNNFKELAPNSEILKKDFSDFIQNSNENLNFSNSAYASGVGISGLRIPNSILRFDLQYNSHHNIFGTYGRDENYPYDTLVSTQTGEPIYVDSNVSRYLQMEHYCEELRFDVSYQIQTNPDARFCFHVGLGGGIGLNFNSKTLISYSEYYSINATYYGRHGQIYSEQESIRNNAFANATVFLPIGGSFRISKAKPFWNQLSLFSELRPSLYFAKIRNYGILWQPSNSVLIGLKYKFR